jgi:hypothetical protein
MILLKQLEKVVQTNRNVHLFVAIVTADQQVILTIQRFGVLAAYASQWPPQPPSTLTPSTVSDG